MKLRAFVVAFKIDHTKRYLAMSLEKQMANKSAKNLLKSGSSKAYLTEKKVRDHIINDLLKQHTFKP